MSHLVTRGVGSRDVVSRGMHRGTASLLPAKGSLVTRGLGTRSAVCRGLRLAPNAPRGTLRRAVAAALGAAPAVAAIVGDRVYPLRPPEGRPHPWVVFQVASDDRRESLDGPTGSALAVVRVGCGSRDFADCDALAQAVRPLFDGFSGLLGGLVTVEAAVSGGEEDSYAAPDDGSDRGVFWTVLDYSILYREN